MARYKIFPSKPSDFYAFYGTASPKSCKAWTVWYDDEIAAIAGVTLNRNSMILFSDMKRGASYPKVAIFKVACYVVEQVAKMKKPVLAAGGDGNKKFLESLGFVYIGTYQGQELYRLWQN